VDGKLIPSAEAARLLGQKPDTLSRWRSRGFGPEYIKLGAHRGRVYYELAAIEAFTESRRRRSTSDTGE
jgi:hypothetical protein